MHVFKTGGNFGQALAIVSAALSKDSSNGYALKDKSNLLMAMDRYADAALTLKAMIRFYPGNPAYYGVAGWCYLLSKQYVNAQYYCSQALEMRPFDYSAYMNLGHVYGAQGNQQLAGYYYRIALEFITSNQQLQSIIQDIKTLKKQGILNIDYEQNIQNFTTTNAEYLKNIRATSLLDSITFLLNTGDFNPLDPEVTSLVNRFTIEERTSEYWRYHVLINCYSLQGDVQFKGRNHIKAITDYYNYSLGTSDLIKDTLAKINQLLTIAAVYKSTGYANDAMGLAVSSNDSTSHANCALHLSTLFRETFRWDSAYHYAKQAYNYSTHLNNRLLSFRSADEMFQNMIFKRDFDSSTLFFNLLYKEMNELGNADNIYQLELNYATLLFKLSHFNEGISFIHNVYAKYDHKKSKNISELDETLGLYYYSLHNYTKAEEYFQKSISGFSEYLSHRTAVISELLSEERAVSFHYLKRMYAASRNAEKLFNLSEVAKSNLIYQHYFNTSAPAAVLNLKQVQDDLKEDEAVISFASSSNMEYGYGVAFDRKNVVTMVENVTSLDKTISEAKALAFKKAATIGYEKLVQKSQGTLKGTPENTATGILLFAAILQVKAVNSIKQYTRGADEQIDSSVSGLTDSKTANDIIYKYYIAPFRSILEGKKTIYISTDLITTLLSFDALKNDEGKYLAELYNIVYVPSFTTRQQLLKADGPKNDAMLAIGNPDYKNFDPKKMEGRAFDLSFRNKAKWEDLPGTKNELDAIKKIIPSADIIEGAAVNESLINRLSNTGKLKDYKYIHFATHGVTSFTDYEDNSLILTEQPGTGYDGYLQFSEVAKLSLRASLVCLSACESAIGQPNDNNDFTLPTAFLMAGAKSVISSSWKIDDIATGIFMREFYKKLVEDKKSVSEALHLTRLQFILGDFGETYKSPMYWGAFKYIGN